MSLASEPWLVLVVLILGLIGIVISYRKQKAHFADLQRRATRDFRALRVEAGNPKYAFVGEEAVVTRREETGWVSNRSQQAADVSVTIYALNRHGEKFLFKWHSNSPKPFIKHVPANQQLSPTAAAAWRTPG